MTEEERQEMIAQRKTLLRLKRSGALSVGHGDKRVQYRSMADLDAAIEEINAELNGGRKRVFYVNARRGY